MDDPELEAIRRARMAELQKGGGGGGKSSNGASSIPGLSGSSSGGDENNQAEMQAHAQAQEEMKRQALSTILDSDARERLSRISLVKPSKAKAVQDLLIRMMQSQQIRQKVTEQQLIGLLDQLEGKNSNLGSGGSQNSSAGKITFTRKKQLDDDDDDFDL